MLDAYSELPGPTPKRAFIEIKSHIKENSNKIYDITKDVSISINYDLLIKNDDKCNDFYNYIDEIINNINNKYNGLGSYTGWLIFIKSDIIHKVHYHILKYWLNINNKPYLLLLTNNNKNSINNINYEKYNNKTPDTSPSISPDIFSPRYYYKKIYIEYQELIKKFIDLIEIKII